MRRSERGAGNGARCRVSQTRDREAQGSRPWALRPTALKQAGRAIGRRGKPCR